MFSALRKPSRLGRWDGRRRSSRGDEPVWTLLSRRDVLWRLGVVLATTVGVTLLVFLLGHPFTYRVGQIYPYNIYPRVSFEMIDKVEQAQQSQVPDRKADLPPGFIVPEIEKKSPLVKFPTDKPLVERNAPISEQQLAVLRLEHQAYLASLTTWEHLRNAIGLLLIFALLASLISLYVVRFQPHLLENWRTFVTICVLVFVTVAAGLIASFQPWDSVFLPMTIAAIILTLAYNPQFALVVSISLSLAMTVALGRDIAQLVVLVAGLAVMILLLRHVRTRTQLVKVSCIAGIAFFFMTLATSLLTEQTGLQVKHTWDLILTDAVRRFAWGTLAGFLLTGLLPLVERAFGIVTDISLREYADGSHPLLQELVRRAPGTYTHSITVATLAEAAAEAIGANPLLVRVGSYFHDVGKMLKPQYFVENQVTGENRHDALEPALSTLIIIGHVKDGIALAKQYSLPRPIIDFIEQHHGTTLVEYFYREALRLHGSNGQGNGGGELEAAFRYPGPKPQSREAGVLMLADAVESASRCLNDPTPARIQKLVHDLLMKRLLDGQFEESGLTLTELHAIEESLNKSLIALFHARIRYREEEPAVQEKAS